MEDDIIGKCEKNAINVRIFLQPPIKDRSRFCSIKCAAEWRKTLVGSNNPNWRGGQLNKKCSICNSRFTAADPRAHLCPQHRSLVRDRNPNWKGRTLRLCAICNREMQLRPFEVRDNKKFCSRSCANVAKNKQSRKRGTSIERQFADFLRSVGIPFEEQVIICGSLVDFVVGTTVIQCDGVYWHSMVGRKEHDDAQDVKLVKAGWTVLRISDHEMRTMSLHDIVRRKAYIATAYNMKVVGWR